MLGPKHEREIESLRRYRVRGERDLSLRAEMDGRARDLKKQERGLGGIAEAWAGVVPPELAERTVLVGVSRGVLTVRAADSVTKWELEVLLRSGGEAELLRRSPVSVRRIRIVA